MLVIIRQGMCAENLKTASLIYFKEPRIEKNNEKVTISEMLVTASPPSDEVRKYQSTITDTSGHRAISRMVPMDSQSSTLRPGVAVLLNLAVHVLSSSSSTAPPIKHRIDFKIANITFRTLYSSQTGLPTSILACLSFHSFSQTLQH